MHRLPGRAIEVARRYWTYPRLERSDQPKIAQIPAARTFLLNHPGLPEPFSDRALQQQLVQQMQGGDPELARLALACLRCFVCHQIEQVCLGLEQQFGGRVGLRRRDLYPYLLDDPDPMADFAAYQPLSVQVLRRFDPSQSSLSTWTKRLVSQNKALHRLLLEDYGIYLATDWGILLQATPERLRRLLAKTLMPDELEQFCQLLTSYHQVYRRDRLAQRTGNSRCAEPTPEQLQQMLDYLSSSSVSSSSANLETDAARTNHPPSNSAHLLKNLRQLAYHLRQLKAIPLSIEIPAIRRQAEQPDPSSDADQSEADQIQDAFLSAYRRVAQTCLQQTVEQVIAERVTYLRGKRSGPIPKHQAYWMAMQLFHCQGQSMTEIAPQVGLSRQYQVSRLLELPALQADLHQRWLLRICVELPKLLDGIFEPAQLAQLQQELKTFIDRLAQSKATEAAKPAAERLEPEEWRERLRQIAAELPRVAPLEMMITQLLKDYQAEVYSPNRSGSTGQIAICICQALNALHSQLN